MNKMRVLLTALLVLYIASFVAASALEYTSPSFKILDPVIVPGSGFSTSSAYQVWTSLGQGAIGLSDSDAYILKGGFLYYPSPSATSAPTSVPPVSYGTSRRYDVPEIVVPVAVCDFNDDKRCNLIDLSIMLFYYNQSGPRIGRYDLSKNGRVDFVDVSILFYYWTD